MVVRRNKIRLFIEKQYLNIIFKRNRKINKDGKQGTNCFPKT